MSELRAEIIRQITDDPVKGNGKKFYHAVQCANGTVRA